MEGTKIYANPDAKITPKYTRKPRGYWPEAYYEYIEDVRPRLPTRGTGTTKLYEGSRIGID